MTDFPSFVQETDLASQTAMRLRELIEATATAANCPLAPCDECPMVDCTLRVSKLRVVRR